MKWLARIKTGHRLGPLLRRQTFRTLSQGWVALTHNLLLRRSHLATQWTYAFPLMLIRPITCSLKVLAHRLRCLMYQVKLSVLIQAPAYWQLAANMNSMMVAAALTMDQSNSSCVSAMEPRKNATQIHSRWRTRIAIRTHSRSTRQSLEVQLWLTM